MNSTISHTGLLQRAEQDPQSLNILRLPRFGSNADPTFAARHQTAARQLKLHAAPRARYQAAGSIQQLRLRFQH